MVEVNSVYLVEFIFDDWLTLSLKWYKLQYAKHQYIEYSMSKITMWVHNIYYIVLNCSFYLTTQLLQNQNFISFDRKANM